MLNLALCQANGAENWGCYAGGVAAKKKPEKNPAAVALGALGGKARAEQLTQEEKSEIARQAGEKGGRARAAKLSKAKRIAQAKTAARARWRRQGNS
jgi:hypothetical protein